MNWSERQQQSAGTLERNKRIKELYSDYTMQEIADILGLSKQRVSKIINRKEDVLTIDTLKKAMDSLENSTPLSPIITPLHESLWEDYKKTLRLSDEQMAMHFVKSVYLKIIGRKEK